MTNPNDEVGLTIPQKEFAPRKTFILAAAKVRFPPEATKHEVVRTAANALATVPLPVKRPPVRSPWTPASHLTRVQP